MIICVQCHDLKPQEQIADTLTEPAIEQACRRRLAPSLWLLICIFLVLSISLVIAQTTSATDDAPGDIAAAAAVAAAAAISAIENSPSAPPKKPLSHGQLNTLTKLAQCLRSYPCGMWGFAGPFAFVLVATAILLIYSGNGANNISGLTTSFFFWLGLGYLIILLLIGAFYAVLRGLSPPYMLGGLLPIAVPWFGALGAVTISLAGVFFYSNQSWDNKFNYWHIGRPLFGAVVGIVAFFLFIIIVVSAGTAVPIFAPNPKPRDFIIYYVLAFLVGYREETFRELIQRVTDLILKPGSAPAADASSVSFKVASKIVTSANLGTAAAAAPVKLIIDIENAGKNTLKYPAAHLENGSAPQFAITGNQLVGITELAPASSKSVEITLTVTATANSYAGALIVTGSNLKAARLALTGQS